KFPFGLGGQPEGAAGWNSSGVDLSLRQERAVVGRVRPAYLLNRPVQVCREKTGVAPNDSQILSLGNGPGAHEEGPCDRDAGLRAFIIKPSCLIGRAAQEETAGSEKHHVRWCRQCRHPIESGPARIDCRVWHRDGADLEKVKCLATPRGRL